MLTLFNLSILLGVGLAAAATALLLRPTKQPVVADSLDTPGAATLRLLFREDRLVDASDLIWALLSDTSKPPTWAETADVLRPLIGDMPIGLDQNVRNTKNDLSLEISGIGDARQVLLSPAPGAQFDWFRFREAEQRLAQVEPAVESCPNPVWSRGSDGAWAWGNLAFQKIADANGGTIETADRIDAMLAETAELGQKRIRVSGSSSRHYRWFEIDTRQSAHGTLYFANSVDAQVRAEEAQRNFVQTLSKTFANLTTGLAIFDRDRRLALFNPALIDLCGVPVEFLSGRPNLFEFFDMLREKRIMSEPRNYDHWRERMAKLVAAASDDRFRETWTLPGGQTFDVMGRPYPDGAIAFLLNDITAEISLTQGFRTEIETMQSTIDAVDDAMAVFNNQGILTVCNAAYKEMWKVDPDTSLDDATIVDTIQSWKAAFHPNPIWPELRDFVAATTDRAGWDSELRGKDGREFLCRVDPICFGSTLVRFCATRPKPALGKPTDDLRIVSG